jgi:hypothetical protein
MLAPAGQTAILPGRLPTPYPSGVPAAPQVGGAGPHGSPLPGGSAVIGFGAGATRPLGIAFLAIVEVAVAVVGLYVALDYAY